MNGKIEQNPLPVAKLKQAKLVSILQQVACILLATCSKTGSRQGSGLGFIFFLFLFQEILKFQY